MQIKETWMLEVAATVFAGHPISLQSRCGNFLLRVVPEKANGSRCMVIVEVVGELKKKFENCIVWIQDADGRMLLEGLMTGGRAARRVDGFEMFNLQTWSMVVKFTNLGGDRVTLP